MTCAPQLLLPLCSVWLGSTGLAGPAGWRVVARAARVNEC